MSVLSVTQAMAIFHSSLSGLNSPIMRGSLWPERGEHRILNMSKERECVLLYQQTQSYWQTFTSRMPCSGPASQPNPLSLLLSFLPSFFLSSVPFPSLPSKAYLSLLFKKNKSSWIIEIFITTLEKKIASELNLMGYLNRCWIFDDCLATKQTN